MLVIVEGPDGTGKTSLIEALGRQVTCTVKRSGVPGPNPFVEYHRTLCDLWPNDQITVFDRFFHGECAYGPVFRNKDLDDHELLFLELEAELYGSIVVWCEGRANVIKERLRARARRTSFDEHVLNDPTIMAEAFKRVAGRSRLRWLSYDSTAGYPPESAATGVHARLVSRRPVPDLFRYAVGNWRNPKAVLVGNRFSGYWNFPPPGDPRWEEDRFKYSRPFIGTNSGRYLLEALLLIERFCTCDVLIINSYKDWLPADDSYRLLRRQLELFDNIVCLGKRALSRVAGNVENVRHVPHPQYWKRFHYHDAAGYARRLEEAIYAPA